MRQQLEYKLHKACYEWMLYHPKLVEYFYTIDHGEFRNIRVAKKLKAKGVKGGVFDILFLKSNKKHPCLWIEIKIGKNTLSDKQKIFKHLAENCNMKCAESRTLDEFINEIRSYCNVKK